MAEPDIERVREIAIEMSELIAEGRWTEKEFLRLIEEVRKAAPDQPNFVEFVLNNPRREWL
jgi:hypothetical protein